MFRFLAKSALATLVWKRYHRSILASLALLLGYFLIAMIHGDYVDYAASATDTSHLWLSYLVKWALLFTVTLVYYFYLRRQLRAPSQVKTETTAKATVKGTKSAPTNQNDSADPFANIRGKQKLKSHADIALERSSKHNKS